MLTSSTSTVPQQVPCRRPLAGWPDRHLLASLDTELKAVQQHLSGEPRTTSGDWRHRRSRPEEHVTGLLH